MLMRLAVIGCEKEIFKFSHGMPSIGRDGALRRPRRVQRRNERCDPAVTRDSFRPLHAGGDIAARCPYQRLVRSTSIPYLSAHGNPATQTFAAPNSVVG